MEPREILDIAFQRGLASLEQSLIDDTELMRLIEVICRAKTRALVRLVLSCALAKVHRPNLDIRKPYIEIGTTDAFSGRAYDEEFLTAFIQLHDLPCNTTTAFLTPALRNQSVALTPDRDLKGREPDIYQAALQLLDAVFQEHLIATDLLAETLRWLVILRDEKQIRFRSLLANLNASAGELPLSSSEIATLIEQHLKQKHTSRLPVLLVAAAYDVVGSAFHETARALAGHNAADKQTGAVGDIEVVLATENKIVTAFEMKDKPVTQEDVRVALEKLIGRSIQNYIFITTAPIDPDVAEFAKNLYEETGGIEFVILDCLGFMKHFLHFFHRYRRGFLESYQRLMLTEPDSAVPSVVKEVWLAMRQVAESR
jgi:SacI restriction endonuclease